MAFIFPRKTFPNFTAILVLLLASKGAFCSLPDTAGWILETEKDSIKIYTRKAAESQTVEFKGIARDSLKIETVANTLLDISGYARWLPHVAESRIVRENNPDHFFVYQRLKFSWPFHDRDIVASVVINRDYVTGTLRAHLQGVRDTLVPVQEGCFRMTRMTGDIELTYIRRICTEVSYSESFDPGGNFPGWLTKIVSRNMPYVVLTTLKKVLLQNTEQLSPEGQSVRQEIERSIMNGALKE
jgi:hypothetical protein